MSSINLRVLGESRNYAFEKISLHYFFYFLSFISVSSIFISGISPQETINNGII